MAEERVSRPQPSSAAPAGERAGSLSALALFYFSLAPLRPFYFGNRKSYSRYLDSAWLRFHGKDSPSLPL